MERHRNPKLAFDNAIFLGELSVKQANANYAGNYMYMHSDSLKDYFKNIITRQYDISSFIRPEFDDAEIQITQ